MSELFDNKLGNLIRTADAIVDRHCGLRANGEVSSIRTQEFSRQVIRETCRRLHRLGYYLEHIDGLSQKHIESINVFIQYKR